MKYVAIIAKTGNGTELSQNAAKYAIIDLGQAGEGWGEYRRKVKAGQRPVRRVGLATVANPECCY